MRDAWIVVLAWGGFISGCESDRPTGKEPLCDVAGTWEGVAEDFFDYDPPNDEEFVVSFEELDRILVGTMRINGSEDSLSGEFDCKSRQIAFTQRTREIERQWEGTLDDTGTMVQGTYGIEGNQWWIERVSGPSRWSAVHGRETSVSPFSLLKCRPLPCR
jgi:hypothetical protein